MKQDFETKYDEECLFCRIIQGELPSAKVYEDEHVFAFLDIAPACKGHTLVVLKRHVRNILDFNKDYASYIFETIQKVAPAILKTVNADGFHVLQNNEASAGQTVFHIHFHIIPRSKNDGINLTDRLPYESNDLMQNLAAQIRENL